MRKGNISLYIAVFLLIGGFLYGIVSLLLLRYEAGDIYPAYSSLRTDPLGTKAFYEGIDEVHDLAAVRNYKALSKLRDLKDTTILYAGLRTGRLFWIDSESRNVFEELVLNGNRLVITFFPVLKRPFMWELPEEDETPIEEKAGEEKAEEKKAGEEEKEGKKEEQEQAESRISFAEWWDVRFEYMELPVKDKEYQSIPAVIQDPGQLPETISWHTSLYFDLSENTDWRVIYTAKGKPVIIEKTFGKGTVVLSADSYFLSNEAIRNERHAQLLAWLIGTKTTVLFDETHLGVRESPGIASLIRKYRLGWFVAGLAILAMLFVWKNAISFVPPHDSTLEEEERSGKDIMAGLVNLLHRNISSSDLLTVCFVEWLKSFAHRRKELGATFDKMQNIVQEEQVRQAKARDPVKYYQSLSRLIDKSNYREEL